MSPNNGQQHFPLGVGDTIILRPCVKGYQDSGMKTRLVGYRKEDFLLVEVVQNDSKPFEEWPDSLYGVAFSEGCLYSFRTKYQERLKDKLLFLDYPDQIHQKQVRKHPRIAVCGEAKLCLKDEEGRGMQKNVEDLMGRTLKGRMEDVSEGGCRLMVRSFKPIQEQILCSIDFSLPDGQQIQEMEAIVLKSKFVEDHTYEVKLKFRGPMEELGKVFFFCQLGASIQGDKKTVGF